MSIIFQLRVLLFYISLVILGITFVIGLVPMFYCKLNHLSFNTYLKNRQLATLQMRNKFPGITRLGRVCNRAFFFHLLAIVLLSEISSFGIAAWFCIAILSLLLSACQLTMLLVVSRLPKVKVSGTQPTYVKITRISSALFCTVFVVYPLIIGIIILWMLFY